MHPSRTPIIGGNWKTHPQRRQDAVQLAADVRNRLGSHRGAEVVLFPPHPFVESVASKVEGSHVAVGGQDLYFEAQGAFTGAVSGAMLASVGCTWALIGHSERRVVFGDTDAVVGKKLEAAITAGLKPVLCIGEQLHERESGQTFAVISRQLEVLRALPTARLQTLVLAYEPVWAIGTGKVASPEQAQEVHAYIRQQVESLHGKAFAQAVRIQYGGSVKATTAAGLMAQPDIDGLLVGGASLKAEEFTDIVRFPTTRSS
jgi:triosephosphate isomerase